MRKSIYVFLFAVVAYLFASTIIPNPHMVGKFGEFIGKADFTLLGMFAYVFPLLLAYLLYLGFKRKYDASVSMKVLGGVILFFDLLFLQSLIFKIGVIGNLFVFTLEKYIGVIGVVILISVLMLWGLFLIFEDRILKAFYKENELIRTETAESETEKTNPVENVNYINNIDEDISNIDLDEEVLVEEKNNIKDDEMITNEDIGENEISDEVKKEDVKQTEAKTEEKNKPLEKDEPADSNDTLNVKHVEELEDTKKLLSEIETGERSKPKNWKFPPLDFLKKPKSAKKEINEAEIDKKIKILIEKLKQFKIEGDVVRYYVGPVVTTFEFKPLPHIKVSKILSLQDDLAMALKAQSIRIQAPIPGKDVVGIEIPNEKVETIYLREILESDIFQKAKSPLTLALGKDIVGAPFVTDLKKLKKKKHFQKKLKTAVKSNKTAKMAAIRQKKTKLNRLLSM